MLYSPFLIAISSANLPWKRLHSTAMPPVVVKTKGVKVPCSTSRTLLRIASSSHPHVYDTAAEWWNFCKTLRLGEKPSRQKRQSLAYPRSHEREHPIRHPVLGSYPSLALLPLIPEGQVPVVHRGKQCSACQPQDHATRYASGWWILLVYTPCMIHRKCISPNTSGGRVSNLPVIAEMNGILELSLF